MASKSKRLCEQCGSGECRERALCDGSVGPITGLPLCEQHHTGEVRRVKLLQQRTADRLRELRARIDPQQLEAERQSLANEIHSVEAAFAEAQTTLLEWKARYVAGVVAAAAARRAEEDAEDDEELGEEPAAHQEAAAMAEAAAERLRGLESAIDEHMAGVLRQLPPDA